MQTKYFIGADISKSKVDFTALDSSLVLISEQVVANSSKALVRFFKHQLKALNIDAHQLLICCENTGIYTHPLMEACLSLNLFLWVENAVKIKHAASDLRGKTDRKDARRIAEYACRYQDKAKPYQKPSEVVRKLKDLTKVRETLLGQQNAIKNQLREAKTHNQELFRTLDKSYKKVLVQLEKSIQDADQQLKELAKQDEKINQNILLLTSIKGVGLLTALGFIIYTDNFTTHLTAKHLACYAGVVPFANESGTIVKRARISHMSNQRLKKLLHTAAMCAIRVNTELKDYYQRKTQDGKNKMSSLNAVRNKLVHRMFAVIARQTPYIENYLVPIKSEQNLLAS